MSLPTMQIKKIIDKLVNVEVYSIFFTGGEPSIRKDLGAIAYRVLRLMPNKPELLDQVLEEEESKWLIEELDKVRHEKKIEIEVHVPPGLFPHTIFQPATFPKVLTRLYKHLYSI